MARLRNPSANEPPIFVPPTSRSTRASPRKAVPESPSTRELRYASTIFDEEESLLVLQSKANVENAGAKSPVRKQRALRPVASNSRLLRKLSDESLAATPDRKDRRRREREEGGAAGIGGLYAKALAKSVAGKQRKRLDVSMSIEDTTQVEQDTVMEEMEVEKSILCDEVEGLDIKSGGDADADEENDGGAVMEVEELEETDEDEEPVVNTKNRRKQPQARRRVVYSSSSSSSSDGEDEKEIIKSMPRKSLQKPSTDMPPPPLTSMRPPFRKVHSVISNWAQDVIDLTDSPEPPESFVLDPPIRARSASLVASRPSTATSGDLGAILHFSPTPTKKRSPHKAPPIDRPTTPPTLPSPSKLVSPSKKNQRIPDAPALRPSIDAFWDPATVNDWNDKHSPAKPLLSPKKQELFKQLQLQMEGIDLSDDESDASIPLPTTSPKKKPGKARNASPTKKPSKPDSGSASPKVADLRAQRKDFAARKHAIAESFLTELDNTIADGRIASLSESTGGVKLIWSRTLKTTAGRANWRREQIRMRTGPEPSDLKIEVRHHCSIELAEKVIDDEERLYNVLAHEYCHLTTFMVSEVRNNPHGAEFKSWGSKVTKAFARKGVEVTTKHSYKIDYKYVWECVTCGYEFKRHSKSVDPLRHSCGKCKGKLAQTKPTPRNGGGKTADGKGEVKKSEYQIFVKANFARVKSDMAGRGEETQMGKVMEVVAREYRAAKEEKSKKVEVKVDEVELALDALKL
ncbi:hypothetical protein P280DRAFT_469143 [Massarina eburnea CBS 473.64]|uniref:SprT-like domain-containing protein n=1 Tax=Massarina eburnea CBS 473.64 TaxID=1395130 RepID=A0A6A6S5V0_9PLEO|nr:hypothetical protein P280DRAFT_469143 [Massarina eburnea CBS 473.64]